LIKDEHLTFDPLYFNNQVKFIKNYGGAEMDYYGQVNAKDKQEGFGRSSWYDGQI